MFQPKTKSNSEKLDPAPILELSSKELKHYYREMLQIRRFEEKAGQLYGMGLIQGFCHLYIGQEACVSGCVSALKEGDKYITSYRDHAHPLALGTNPDKIMAELYGKNYRAL